MAQWVLMASRASTTGSSWAQFQKRQWHAATRYNGSIVVGILTAVDLLHASISLRAAGPVQQNFTKQADFGGGLLPLQRTRGIRFLRTVVCAVVSGFVWVKETLPCSVHNCAECVPPYGPCACQFEDRGQVSKLRNVQVKSIFMSRAKRTINYLRS